MIGHAVVRERAIELARISKVKYCRQIFKCSCPFSSLVSTAADVNKSIEKAFNFENVLSDSNGGSMDMKNVLVRWYIALWIVWEHDIIL